MVGLSMVNRVRIRVRIRFSVSDSGENLNQKTLGGELLPECLKSHVCLCDLLQLQYSQLRSEILLRYKVVRQNRTIKLLLIRYVTL